MAKDETVKDNSVEQSSDVNWWVERLRSRERLKPEDREVLVGATFFRSVEGYDQEQATRNLTDLNLKLLTDANPAPGEWGYVALVDERSPEAEIERVKRALPLPPEAHAVLVDSGLSLRAIVSGTPVGERLLEFNFIDEASFDCWIRGEWIREEVYRGKRELLRRAAGLLRKYMAKDLVREKEFFSAPRAQGSLPPARTEW
ncbi:MAG: hypothetical protein AB7G75_07245 [Candidatus Binatia bacterium]